MLRALSHRNVMLYFIGQTLSTLGDRSLWLAMGIWVKMLTGSSAAAGMTVFCYTVGTLLGPLGGMVADRYRRRPLLVLANAVTGGVILLLLLVSGRDQVWLIYLVMFFYGAFGTVITAGGNALVATVVEDDLLAEANSLVQTGSQGVWLVAPLLGAGLLAAVGASGVIWLDAATFAAAILALVLLRVTETRPEPTETHFLDEATAGIRHLLRTVDLRQLVVAALFTVVAFGFVESVVFAVVGNGLHRKPEFLGYLMAAMGVGAIAASTVAARLMKRYGEGGLVGLGMAAFAVGALLLTTPSLPVTVVGMVLFGVSLPWINIGIITVLQRRTPPELRGRVLAGFDFLFSPLQGVAIALGAALIATVDYRVMLTVMAALVAVASGYLFTRPEQRIRPADAEALEAS
ncbi:MFS transporter [Catenulispora rubra]|uniref:MFS transporter n=1 Tax=Catenulispora rubra TaxID=280293 RepID=UPI0018923846|nr:MFS transporter [Catenulispora rubra]